MSAPRIHRVLVACSILLAVNVQGASPRLNGILPRGAQRGTTATFHLRGERLGDVRDLIIYPSPHHDGGTFTVTDLKAVDGEHVEATIDIAADCPLGEHALRVRTASGISTMRTFWVGLYASVDEVEPNSTFDQPQPVAMNVTVAGVVENEDVDHFVVEAKKGQRLSVEIEGLRLGATMFDPYVAILDAKRFELSASDDTALLLQDSIASVVVPEDGVYVVQVRESAYGGAGSCRYRLHIGDFPRPRVVYPAGGGVGETLDLQMLGDVTGPYPHPITLPVEPVPRHLILAAHGGLDPPSPNVLRVSPFPNVLETEPNDARGDATASAAPLPVALNGVLQTEGDVDWFRVTGKKGQAFSVRAHGRSLRSPVDGVLAIHRADGNQLAHNDDAGGPDSGFEFTVPEDGEYLVAIHDHLMKGGATFVYRIEFEPIVASVTSHIPRFGRDSQARQVVAVPRGNRTAILLNGNRSNFGGALVFEVETLPQGVALHGQTMPSDLRQMPFVFEASADAPLAGDLVDLVVRHEDASQGIRGGFRHHVVLVSADNNTEYYGCDLHRLPLAVTESVPFSLELVTPSVPLVQRGTMALKVLAHREEGFTKPITVRMLWKPPGVSAKTTVQIPEGASEVTYPISANAGAQTKTWQIVVLGEVDPGNGGVRVSSALTPLTVSTPYIGMKIDMTALDRGDAGEIVCTLQQNIPFEGEAVAELLGLPHQVSTETLRFTREDEQILFPITTGTESPTGIHKNLFCRVVLQENGTDIPHEVGHGGKLRLDPPPPPAANPPPKPKPKPKPEPKPDDPPKKRLTRLEQLRLQAKEREDAARMADE